MNKRTRKRFTTVTLQRTKGLNHWSQQNIIVNCYKNLGNGKLSPNANLAPQHKILQGN